MSPIIWGAKLASMTLLVDKLLENILAVAEEFTGSASALRSFAFTRMEAQEIPEGMSSILPPLSSPHPVAMAARPIRSNVVPRFILDSKLRFKADPRRAPMGLVSPAQISSTFSNRVRLRVAIRSLQDISHRRVLRDTEQVFHRQHVVAKNCVFGKPARQAGFFEVVNRVCNLLYRRPARPSFWMRSHHLFRTRSSTHSWREDLTQGHANVSAPPSFGGFICWHC